jgi:hypothetical protein
MLVLMGSDSRVLMGSDSRAAEQRDELAPLHV